MGKTCFEGPGLLVIFALPSSSKEYDFIVQLFGFFLAWARSSNIVTDCRKN